MPDAILACADITSSLQGLITIEFSGLVLVLLIATLIACGARLYVLIGFITAYLLLTLGGDQPTHTIHNALGPLIEDTRALADKAELLAIPFFVLAGAIMTAGDIARRLVGIARATFCWLPGGLAISAVMACIFFAAISGSSPVTVIAIGTMMYPVLLDEQYSESFSSGLLTSAGSLGILIPPSIPMLIYVIVYAQTGRGNDSAWAPDKMPLTDGCAPAYDVMLSDPVTAIFLAGIGPGILIGLVLALYAIYEGKRRKVPTQPFKLEVFLQALLDGFWALMLPVILLGGIYTGLFNVTEAAGVAVVYSFLVEAFIHGDLKYKEIPKIFSESAVLMGTLLIIIAMALGLNAYLSDAEIPDKAVAMIRSWNMDRFTFLIVLNILLIIVGCLMDIMSAILILVPLLGPVGTELGIHPIHLSIIFIVNLEIGYLTPPLGLNLFVASTIFKRSIGEVIASVMPFTGLMLISLMIVTFVPGISLAPLAIKKGTDIPIGFRDTLAPDKVEECRGGAAKIDTSVEIVDASGKKVELPEDVKSDIGITLAWLTDEQKDLITPLYSALGQDAFLRLINVIALLDEEDAQSVIVKDGPLMGLITLKEQVGEETFNKLLGGLEEFEIIDEETDFLVFLRALPQLKGDDVKKRLEDGALVTDEEREKFGPKEE